jgi:hypothetical protein
MFKAMTISDDAVVDVNIFEDKTGAIMWFEEDSNKHPDVAMVLDGGEVIYIETNERAYWPEYDRAPEG